MKKFIMSIELLKSFVMSRNLDIHHPYFKNQVIESIVHYIEQLKGTQIKRDIFKIEIKIVPNQEITLSFGNMYSFVRLLCIDEPNQYLIDNPFTRKICISGNTYHYDGVDLYYVVPKSDAATINIKMSFKSEQDKF